MSTVQWNLAGAALLFMGASFANAQTAFDVNLGFGGAWDSANGGGIDNAASLNAFGSCTPGAADINCQSLPSLSGFFLGFGGDLMLYKHFGVGFEANLQPSRQNYGPLESRQIFYDVNGIYAPISVKRASLQFEGGIGGARTSFAYSQSGCVGTAVCTTSTEPVGSASHFQVHVGVGVQIFLTSHIFVRPEFDFHYVPGLTNQFGSDAVPEGLVWVGYSFGER
ncbi:MAG: outer membrane beta-barrel protein [Bryobacterales bacterium]|nr:outer membrane beta-barrel protein [Bryobacterales bacterium]